MFNLSASIRLLGRSPPWTRSSSNWPRPPPLSSLATQEDMREARAWVAQFEQQRSDDFPRDLLTISYSRSSGPGGQNVNKLSTKCTTRFALPSPTLIPPYILPALRSCPHYVASPPSVLLSSSVHRTQPQNLADCLRKLKLVLLDAAKRDLVGETSAEQKKKVQELAKKEKRRTEGQKKERKDVKSGRRTGKSSKDWD